MKAKFYILPVITIALASFWLIKQRQTISTVEGTSTQFEKQIAAVRSPSPGADLTPTPPAAPAMNKVAAQVESQTDKEPLNWKNIALQWEAVQQNTDATELSLLRQRFKLMSPAELVAALEEVATHNLSALARMDLTMHLIVPLVEKSPELALTHQMEFLGDNTFGMGWQLADVTEKWAKKDPARATAWFAEQLAAGRFDSKSLDGKSDLREKIEGALFGALLGTDSIAAARSLGAMAEEQRIQVMGKYSTNEIKEENQLTFVKLLRSHLSEQDQAKLLGDQGFLLARVGGYAKVEAFLKQISATPAERAACVGEAAREKVTSISGVQKITRP